MHGVLTTIVERAGMESGEFGMFAPVVTVTWKAAIYPGNYADRSRKPRSPFFAQNAAAQRLLQAAAARHMVSCQATWLFYKGPMYNRGCKAFVVSVCVRAAPSLPQLSCCYRRPLGALARLPPLASAVLWAPAQALAPFVPPLSRPPPCHPVRGAFEKINLQEKGPSRSFT